MLQSVEVGIPRHSARGRQVCKRGRAKASKLNQSRDEGKDHSNKRLLVGL